MKHLIGNSDILFLTFDTLRYDAAQQAWQDGRLTTLAPYLGPRGWEKRHTPASFTYAAHQAFLSGFLPTPLGPGPHPRLFAAEFGGSLTTVDTTFVFQEATLPQALAARGYHTICIGGTGFFNQQNELARVLPGLFAESHWRPDLGVACRESAENQVAQAIESATRAGQQRLLLFINIAAIHQPNWFYGASAGPDTLATHTAAFVAVDRALKPLFERLRQRAPTFAIACSDHGHAYGEDGYFGHRLGHEVVWTVPYADFML
ncbi:MAG TPA: STM4013/SEN3800 family hydrolase [Candidatus Sulfotelmatobacter sp.]|nr:STM4013/SEN3800 family hydrolase [Candidatus Sulfotelmatobacter sp.]HWI58135.1 STM4013/SEN3800 family hydrolase [Bacillota bacterium]